MIVGGTGTCGLAILRRSSVALAPRWTTPAQATLIALSIAAAVAAMVYLLIAPAYASGSTVLQVNGPGAIAPLLIPVALAALPALALRLDQRTIACGAVGTLLGVFSFVTGFSIGLLYVPAGSFLVIAATAGLFRTTA